MNDFFLFYAESNIVCFVIFGIMFFHDLKRIDSQEKQLKYDRTLLAFMLYFVSDSIWAAVMSGAIPKTPFTVLIPNISNMILMAVITYFWFTYALATAQVPNRNDRGFRIISALPLALAVVIVIILFIVAPDVLLDEEYSLKPIYSVLQVGPPIIYIIGVLVFTIGRAQKAPTPEEKSRLLYVGIFPLMVVIGGIAQVLSRSDSPIFCFSSTILMITFYIRSMEGQISADPLTGLNNRGQLSRYISQENSIKREGRLTYVVMIDINDFKKINDTYGHNNGDKALVAIADALRKAMGKSAVPGFLGRYGGDEFILIAHPQKHAEMEALDQTLRECIHEACVNANMPFDITVGIGYEFLNFDEGDTFHNCLERADLKLYANKATVKATQLANAGHNKA